MCSEVELERSGRSESSGSNSRFHEAVHLHQKGEVAEAERIYQGVLREHPDHAAAWHLLGVAMHQRGDHAGGLDLIGRAISLDPSNGVYFNNYGAALVELGRVIEAIGCFQRAIVLRPNYPDAETNLKKATARLREMSVADTPDNSFAAYPHGCKTEYTGADIVFYLQVYRDFELAEWCLGNLKRHFAESRVIMLSDGDDDPRFDRLAGQFSAVECVYGDRLYELRHGGAMIHRMLDHFFRSPAGYLISIDTDTAIHRRFRYLPTRPGLFGTPQRMPADHGGQILSIQGGFIGMTLSLAAQFYEAQCFLDRSLGQPVRAWAQCEFLQSLAEQTGRISQDWLFGHCAAKLGLPMYEFDEVKSKWTDPVPNPDLKYAATHPCKEGE